MHLNPYGVMMLATISLVHARRAVAGLLAAALRHHARGLAAIAPAGHGLRAPGRSAAGGGPNDGRPRTEGREPRAAVVFVLDPRSSVLGDPPGGGTPRALEGAENPAAREAQTSADRCGRPVPGLAGPDLLGMCGRSPAPGPGDSPHVHRRFLGDRPALYDGFAGHVHHDGERVPNLDAAADDDPRPMGDSLEQVPGYRAAVRAGVAVAVRPPPGVCDFGDHPSGRAGPVRDSGRMGDSVPDRHGPVLQHAAAPYDHGGDRQHGPGGGPLGVRSPGSGHPP